MKPTCHRYLNHYLCPCGTKWDDEGDCMCNDKCPECNKEIEPYESEDLGDDFPCVAPSIC